jgi:hypothetical protein
MEVEIVETFEGSYAVVVAKDSWAVALSPRYCGA